MATEEHLSPDGPPPLPGSAPPPARDTHAVHHETQATRTYPCGTCGSALVFDPGVQQLRCRSCGNVQALVEVRGAVVERDLVATIAQMRAQAPQVNALVAGEKEIVCQSCGGHTTFTGSWTAQRCPFCATPIQRDDVHDAPDRLAVDGVLPFQVDDAAADAALKQWVSSRWFAPTEFKEYGRAGSFASIYTAWFTFDADTWTSYTGERGDDRTETHGSGDDEYTTTTTDWRRVSGQVSRRFDDLTVLANDGLNPKHTAAIDTWPMDKVQPFSPEFMAGHLSRTYDDPLEQCATRARSTMETMIERDVRSDIGGDHQRIHSRDTRWSGVTFKHVLLPVWLLTVIYGGQTYQVLINGATGQIAGERPYSKVKIAAAVVAALVVIALLVILLGGGS